MQTEQTYVRPDGTVAEAGPLEFIGGLGGLQLRLFIAPDGTEMGGLQYGRGGEVHFNVAEVLAQVETDRANIEAYNAGRIGVQRKVAPHWADGLPPLVAEWRIKRGA